MFWQRLFGKFTATTDVSRLSDDEVLTLLEKQKEFPNDQHLIARIAAMQREKYIRVLEILRTFRKKAGEPRIITED